MEIPCVFMLLILGLIWPAAAYAAPRVELTSEPVIESSPGMLLSAGIRVTNDGTATQAYQIAFVSPEGWTCSAFPETVEIEAGQSEVVFLSIDQPLGASAGDYPITISCYPVGIPTDVASVELTVRVPVVMLLWIRANVESPADAYSGDELVQTFTVANYGNERAVAAIDVESGEDWPYQVDPSDRRLDLEPNQRGTVTVSTAIPEELDRADTYRLTVIARPVDVEGLEWRAGTSTRVIPRRLSAGSIYATLDGNVRAQIASSGDDDFSLAIAADTLESEIMEGRTIRLGPINIPVTGESRGSFGRSQRMVAEYEDVETGYVRAGDFSIDLMSPLMGRYVSGRGGDLLYRSGPMDYRVFYTRSRGSIPEELIGIQLARNMDDVWVVRLTAIRDSELSVPEGYERETESSTNLGLLTEFNPSEDLEVEGSIGRSNVSGSGSDDAWRVYARYELERFSANCEWLHAGPDFRGGWEDTELKRLNLSWSFLEDARVWANYSQTRYNLASDPEEEGRRNRNMAYGAIWYIEGLGQFRVSQRIDRTRDIVQEDYDTERRTTEYSLSRSWGDFRLSTTWQDQIEDDRITGERETDRTLRAELAARLGPDASARIGYSSTRTTSPGEETERTTSITIDADARLGEDLDASIGLQRNSGRSGADQTNVNGTLRWEMDGGGTINLSVRSYTGAREGDTEVALEYTYPLSIPLTMFPRKGNVEGRVFRSDNPEQGIADVGILIGNIEMVTDDNGYFTFPALDPGEYELTVDTISLGVGMTPDVQLPMVIVVEAGSTAQVEIPVKRSVMIGGQVFLESPGARGEPPVRRPLGEAVVELQSAEGSSYRSTDLYGRFLFSDLDAGHYVVILRSEWLPQWHEVVGTASYELDLAPGESKRDIEFIVAPVEREIEVTVGSPEE